EVVVPYSFGQRIAEPGRRCGYRQRYPVVRANMQLMSYRRGENNGLMAVFTQDPLGRIKELECLRDRPRTHEFHLSWTHYPDEGPGQVASFTLDFPARIVLTEGDWYDAARIYRTWATEQMWTGHGSLRGRPDRPEWLADVSMWFRAHGDGPELAATLDEMRQTVFESTDDPPAIAVRYYDWHQIPFDNNYPEYFPAKEGVAQAIDQLWQEGIAVMPYINGQLWDRDTKSWLDLNALDFATRDRWGALVTETWAGQEHSVMCPYTSLWHTVQVDLATCILGDASCTYLGAVYSGLHAPALYIDQVGETRPVMCHAAHGSDPASQHPPGGVLTWVAGRRALMADIRSLEGSLDREIFLSTEGGAEPYLDLFDGFLMLSSRDVIDKVPLWTAVYNEYIVNFTVGISAAELAGTNSAARSKLAESFLFGSQGSVYEWWIDCGAEPLQFEFITRLGLAWRAGSEYLAYGEMQRPPRLSGAYDLLEELWQLTDSQYRQVLSPSVRAAAYRADDGSIGLFVTNASLSEQPVTIEWEYGRRVIEERLLDGSTVAHGTGDSLDLVMEPIDVRMFVLTEELTLEEELELDEVVLDRPLEPTDAGPGEPDLSDDLDLAGDLPEEPDVGEEVETDDPVDPDALADREEATDMQADPDAPLSPAEAPEGCRCSAVPNSYNWHLAAILLAIWLVRRRVRLDAGSRDNV
ncbi:MAG: hypothetical protein JW797_12610, partial [Bradymonadales bacterium]|nr:hypothetical protein [Bradymonadales bacterium]